MQVPACLSVHELLCQEVQLSEGCHAERVVMPLLKYGVGNAELAQGEEEALLHEGLEVGGGSASNAISQVTGPQIALADSRLDSKVLCLNCRPDRLLSLTSSGPLRFS